MANEVVYSDLVTNGGAVAEVLSAMVMEQLYDPTDLREICTNIPYNNIGSLATAVTKDAVPGAFAEVVDGASVSNSAYTTDEFPLSVTQYMRAHELTDLVGISGSPINLDRLVNSLTIGVSLTMTDLICLAFGNLSQTAGTSGVNLSVDDIFEAQFKLNTALNSGPIFCVLAPVQMNDLRTSIRGESGTIQFQPATAEMLQQRGPGFQGEFNGISFFQSDSCVTSGGNRIGAMLTQGCLGYTLAPVARMQGHVPTQNILVNTPELLVELVRDGYGGQTAAVAHMYPGVAEIEDARGVGIVTDA